MAKAWWRKRALRIYHPNPRESELRDLDVSRLVADCVLTNAEAIVISVGGVYAFYPSEVPYHYVSPVIGDHDLVGEIVTEAQARGLRVIARVDFSKARADAFQAHPDWFQRDANGAPVRSGEYYCACPLGGYQREGFALPVLREIQRRYGVDGFHLNAGGFGGFCYCPACQDAFAAAYGGPLPTDAPSDPVAWQNLLRWRDEAIGAHMALLYGVLQELDPDAFFMAELAGPQNPSWALRAAHHLPSLARSSSQLLLTAGEVSAGRVSRDWVALACEQARAARRKRNPIINIKMQMREMSYPHALMPPTEFAFHAYQAIAHGAGLKIPTFGLPEHQADPRALPALAEVFGFMRQQQAVLDSMLPIAQVAIVWPEAALRQSAVLGDAIAEGLRNEVLGLAQALRSRHIPYALLYDEKLTIKALARFEAVIVSSVAYLTAEQIATLRDYAHSGGVLVVLDSPSPTGQFAPLPTACSELFDDLWEQEAVSVRYALADAERAPDALRQLGPIALTRPYRRVRPPNAAQVWLWASQSSDIAIPEDLAAPERSEDPIAFAAPMGEGVLSYIATGLGTMMRDVNLPEYALLLQALLCQGTLCHLLLSTDAPSSVEVTLAHWAEGVVVHLLNGSGAAPLDRAAPVGPITLDLAWDGPALAQLCAPGEASRALQCEEHWNRVRIVVPKLELYAQVVVQSA